MKFKEKLFLSTALLSSILVAPADNLANQNQINNKPHEKIYERFLIPPATPLPKNWEKLSQQRLIVETGLNNTPKRNKKLLEGMSGSKFSFLYEKLGPVKLSKLIGRRCGNYALGKRRIENIRINIPKINYHVKVSTDDKISALDMETAGLMETGLENIFGCEKGEEVGLYGILQKHLEGYVKIYSPEVDPRSINLFNSEHNIFLASKIMKGLAEKVHSPLLIGAGFNGGRSEAIKVNNSLKEIWNYIEFIDGEAYWGGITLGDILYSGKDVFSKTTKKHLERFSGEYQKFALKYTTYNPKENKLKVGQDPSYKNFKFRYFVPPEPSPSKRHFRKN